MSASNDLRARNFAFFDAIAPELAGQLRSHRPALKLRPTVDGTWDLLVGERPVYAGGYARALSAQINNFQRSPAQRFLAPPEPGRFDAYTERLIARIRADAEAAGIHFADAPTAPKCHYLFALGIGFGGHLIDICRITGCRVLHVLDMDIEHLFHALAVTDWTAVSIELSRLGVTFRFTFRADPMDLAMGAVSSVRLIDPAAADGYTFFVHRPDPVLIAAAHLIEREMAALYGDVGHFYDEMLMLKNAHANLAGGALMFRRDHGQQVGAPIFVVGSGPSLDQSFGDLKRLRHGGIVISCGSALRALLTAGIRPDFQIEIENIDVEPTIQPVAEQFDLADITLVAAVSTDAGAANRFKKRLFFHRRGLVTYPFLATDETDALAHTDPTVGNAGLAFALALRPTGVYLFGLDLGVRVDNGMHHAKDSYHYLDLDDQIVSQQDLLFDIEGPANFGGTAKSSRGFHLARLGMEAAIVRAPNVRVWNCSDGIQIGGATPMQPADIPVAMTDAPECAARISAAADALAPETFQRRWRAGELAAEIDELAKTLIAETLAAPSQMDRQHMNRMMEILTPAMQPEAALANPISGAALWSLRGTVYMFLIAVRYLAVRQSSGEPAAANDIFKAALAGGIQELVRVADAALADPSAALPAGDLPLVWVPPPAN